MTTEEINEKGYAVPLYDIDYSVRHWKYKGAVVTRQAGDVPEHDIGLPFKVAKWEDVCAS